MTRGDLSSHSWLWDQRRPRGADRGGDSQARSPSGTGPLTHCLPQASGEWPFPLPWERGGGTDGLPKCGMRSSAGLLPPLLPGKLAQHLCLVLNKRLSVPCFPTAQPAGPGSSVKAEGLQADTGARACLGGLPLGRSGLQGMSLTLFPVWKKRSREINNVEGSLRGGLKANPQLSTSILSWGPEPGKALECGLCDGAGPGGLLCLSLWLSPDLGVFPH